MKEFWDERYSQVEYVYGKEPNVQFKDFIQTIKPGKILFPAEGEGRNAVYAATLGWEVEAFDMSSSAKEKAEDLAAFNNVTISFTEKTYESMDYDSNRFDVIALSFTHINRNSRKVIFDKLTQYLKKNGYIYLIGFSKNQLGKESGGPNDLDMLFSMQELREDFDNLQIQELREFDKILHEGRFHLGSASLIEMIAQKI